MLEFFEPKTVDDAKELLSENNNSKLLAGGTDLVLYLERENENTKAIVDIHKLPELRKISEDNSHVIIGSMVTFTELLENDILRKNFNSIYECSKNMGSPQIRNTATIGGNIANASAAADIVPCLICLDSTLLIESINDKREVSCEEYFGNYSSEKLKKNEILTEIRIPKKYEKSGYYKLGKRNSLAIARISAAVGFNLENNIIKAMSVSLGAVGRFPFRVQELEKIAPERNINWLFTDEPLDILEKKVYESIKGRKTMPFKKEAIKGVYKEAVQAALSIK